MAGLAVLLVVVLGALALVRAGSTRQRRADRNPGPDSSGDQSPWLDGRAHHDDGGDCDPGGDCE